MSNVIQFPVIAGIEITTDAEGRFNLKALQQAASDSGVTKDIRPNEWMKLQSTQEMASVLITENPCFEPIVSKPGRYGGTFVHELLAISYAGWISPAFQLKVNQVFLDYRTGKLQPQQPKLGRKELARMVIEAEEEAEKLRLTNQQLSHQITEDAPKVEFAKKVELSHDAIPVSQAAKILGTGQKRLFAFMRTHGWVTRKNEPYQSKIEAGYLDVKISSWDHPTQGLQRAVTALVTGKGLAKLQKMWAEDSAFRAA